MTDQKVFAVCIPDASQAIQQLWEKRFEFECLLDYVAMTYPDALVKEYGPDLSILRDQLEEEISDVSCKHLSSHMG